MAFSLGVTIWQEILKRDYEQMSRSYTTVLQDKWSKHNKGSQFARFVFTEAVQQSTNFAEVTRALKLHPNGTVNRWIEHNVAKFHLDTSHWKKPISKYPSALVQKNLLQPGGVNRYAIAPAKCTNCLREIPWGHKICSSCHWSKKPTSIDMRLLEQSVRLFFQGIGDDPNRDGIKDTPKRVAKMWAETMNGYFLDPNEFLTTFQNDGAYDGPVILKDAEFYTICEHHLQPFAGTIDIAYGPGERIVGLSKLLRVARVYAKRPQVQERLTKQIADQLNELLEPKWVAVRIKAEHHCMKLRGVRINGSYTITESGHGIEPRDIFGL